MPLRVVLDTNIVVSGFLWRGLPNRILKATSLGTLHGFSSLSLLDELDRTLSYPKFKTFFTAGINSPEQLTATYESFVDIVVPCTLKETVVIADPSDDIVIATALAANAQFVITGNKHLLDLSHPFHFKIIAPALFIRELN